MLLEHFLHLVHATLAAEAAASLGRDQDAEAYFAAAVGASADRPSIYC